MVYEMKSHNRRSRLLNTVLFFPDPEYLADKWWHRLATVLSWIWLISVTGGALWGMWEQYEYARTEGISLDPAGNWVLCGVWLLSLFVPTVVYRIFLFVYSAFPDSEYLADKWWHRLAIVICWSWLLLATGFLVAAGMEIFEKAHLYSAGDTFLMTVFALLVYSASLLLPSVVYRAILFICTGSAWQGTKGA